MNRSESHKQAVLKSQKAKEEYLKIKNDLQQEQKNRIEHVRSSWEKIKDEPFIAELVKSIKSYVELNTILAMDRDKLLSDQDRSRYLDYAVGARSVLEVIEKQDKK